MHHIGFTGRLVVTSTTAVEVEPLSVYAATKLHQEQLALAFGREHGVPVEVLRLPAVVGDGMSLDSPDLHAPGEPMPVDEAAAVIVGALCAPTPAHV
jgi:nucleoside-diphosphate-sugar epimerase